MAFMCFMVEQDAGLAARKRKKIQKRTAGFVILVLPSGYLLCGRAPGRENEQENENDLDEPMGRMPMPPGSGSENSVPVVQALMSCLD